MHLERKDMRSFGGFLGIVAAVIVLTVALPARADITWTRSADVTGDWSVATNWSGGAVPTSTDNADVFNGGTASITTTADACSNLSLGSTAGSGSIQMYGGMLNVGNAVAVGYSGTGNFSQSGGTSTIARGLTIGAGSGSNGSYTLSGGSLAAAVGVYDAGETIGSYYGTGLFTQSGGTNTTNILFLESNSAYSLGNTGCLSLTEEYVGWTGTATFSQSGGTNTIGDDMILGEYNFSAGTFNLSGNAVLSASDNEVLAVEGTGVFNQTGGTNTVSNWLMVGDNTNKSTAGTYNLSGNALVRASDDYVGYWGPGTVNQSGGTNTISGTLNLGGLAAGTYNLSGASSLTAANECLGVVSAGQGNFGQSAGTNTVSAALFVGWEGPGTYSLYGNGFLSAPSEFVGYIAAVGNFTQSAGTNNAGSLTLAFSSNSSGTYNLNGGILVAGGLSNGSGTAAFNFGGGTLQPSGNLSTALPMTLTGSGGNATVDTGGYTVTLSGSLSGNGGLTKTDAGVLILSASNIYSGGTIVDAGILEVANGTLGSATGSGSVTLSGGTLTSGTAGGSISGAVQIATLASAIAPGGFNSIGKLTIGSLVTGSKLRLNFDLTTPGGSNDLLAVTGNLTLNPNTAITFGTDPTAYGDYRLIGYGSLTGSLSDFDLPSGPYSLSTSVDPGYIDLVVPEPSTLVLLGIAAVGLLGWAWRMRKRAT